MEPKCTVWVTTSPRLCAHSDRLTNLGDNLPTDNHTTYYTQTHHAHLGKNKDHAATQVETNSRDAHPTEALPPGCLAPMALGPGTVVGYGNTFRTSPKFVQNLWPKPHCIRTKVPRFLYHLVQLFVQVVPLVEQLEFRGTHNYAQPPNMTNGYAPGSSSPTLR